MRTLNYGTIPDDLELTEPFEMELVGSDAKHVTAAINQGIDSHLEAVHFDQFIGEHGKLGIRIKDAGSMRCLLRRLMEAADWDDEEGPQNLASCIVEVLGYEWV